MKKKKWIVIGIVQFIGHDKNADFNRWKELLCDWISSTIIKSYDDTQDYYYYIPLMRMILVKKKAL